MSPVETPTANAAELFDTWLSVGKSFNWTQDQMQTLVSTWLEQGRTMHHDGEKVLEVMTSQAKANAEEWQRAAQERMQSHLTVVPGWDLLTQADLRRQVAELSVRVDALEAR